MDQPNATLSGPTPNDGNKQGLGTSYMDPHASEQSWNRWRQIQGDFVDDPRGAVTKARALVGELIDEIVHRFENERAELEERWSHGENVSTEDLRRSLQRYRDFFGRLLTKLDEEPGSDRIEEQS